MYQFGRVDHALAGCSGDVDFIVFDPLAVHPEGEGAKAARLGKIFRHPGSMRAERFGKILHQRGKETAGPFRWRSLRESRAVLRRFQDPGAAWRYRVVERSWDEIMRRDVRQIQEGE